MTRKYRSHQKPKQDPDIREVKFILLGVGIAMMFLIGTATLGQQAQPLRFLDGIIPLAFAEEQKIWMLGDLNSPSHAGAGATCDLITSPTSATDTGGAVITHSDTSDAAGCTFNAWTFDRTTTSDSLIPEFYNDLMTGLEFIHSQSGNSFFSRDCRAYGVSNFGHDPRLNITGAYDVIDDRTFALTNGFENCDAGSGKSNHRFGIIGDYLSSMALNSTFFSYGVNIILDERDPPTTDNTVTAGSFLGFTFTNPTALNNTVWMMQEHPKFPTADLDGGFFGIDDTTFTMDSNTVDDTEIGQVVVFREFEKSDLGGWDTSSLDFLSGTSPRNNELSQDTQNQDLFWKPDGLTVFALGIANDLVYEYRLNNPEGVTGAQAWNSTSCYKEVGGLVDATSNPINSCRPSVTGADTFSVITESSFATGLFFKPDGLKMYISDNTDKDIDEYTLSTAYDISTASYSQSGSVISFGTLEGFEMTSDGKRLYTADGNSANITQYDLGTAWDISTISFNQFYDASVFSGDDGITSAQDVVLRPDGGRMFIMDDDASGVVNHIETYDLSTPFDISTATWVEKNNLSSQSGSNVFEGIFFKPDGLQFYAVTSDRKIHEWSSPGSASIGVRITGGIVSQTSAADQWLRVEVKDGSYGSQQIESFPEDEYDIYQGAGSLGVIHLEPTTTITPFEINLKPNWFDGLEETVTLFIGIDDNSTGGSTIVNITSIEWANTIKYDFEDINVLEFYETTPNEITGGLNIDQLRTAFNDYDAGILNVTEVATGSVTIPALPAPSVVTGLSVIAVAPDKIDLNWSHDLLNVTSYNIYRDSVLIASTETPIITQYEDVNQPDTGLANMNLFENALGLEPNTNYSYDVCAVNGAVEGTCASGSDTTPDDTNVWQLKEHDGDTDTSTAVATFSDGGTTFDIESDLLGNVRNGANMFKVFNITEIFGGNADEFGSDFESFYGLEDLGFQSQAFSRLSICEGSFNRFNTTMFVNQVDLTCGGNPTLYSNIYSTTLPIEAHPRLIIDWKELGGDLITVLYNMRDRSATTAFNLQITNFTITNQTTWNMGDVLSLNVSTTKTCNLSIAGSNSADNCDLGVVEFGTSSNEELKATRGSNDWEYIAHDHNEGGGLGVEQITVDSSGLHIETFNPFLPDELDEETEITLFKQFNTTDIDGLDFTVNWSATGGAGFENSMFVADGVMDRWNFTTFADSQSPANYPQGLDSLSLATIDPPFSTRTDTFQMDLSGATSSIVTAALEIHDNEGNSIDSDFQINWIVVGLKNYTFSGGATQSIEVSSNRNWGDRGLITPNSTITSAIPNPPPTVNATAFVAAVQINWTEPVSFPDVDTYHIERSLALNDTWQFRQQKVTEEVGQVPKCGWSVISDHLRLTGDGDGPFGQQQCVLVKTFPREFLDGSQIQIKYDYTTGIQPEQTHAKIHVRDNIIEVDDDSEWAFSTARDFDADAVGTVVEFGLGKNSGLRTDNLISTLARWDKPDSEFASIVIDLTEFRDLSNGQRVDLFWINVTDFTTGEPRGFFNFTGDSIKTSFPETCAGGPPECLRGSITSTAETELVHIASVPVNLPTPDFFDDFTTDQGWSSNRTDGSIDIYTETGTLNITKLVTNTAPLHSARISLNIDDLLTGGWDESKWSLRGKVQMNQTTTTRGFVLLGVSEVNQQNMSGNLNNFPCGFGVLRDTGCIVFGAGNINFWQFLSKNATSDSNTNLNLTESYTLDSFIYPEIVVDGDFIRVTVYSDENYQHVLGCTNDKFDSSSGDCVFEGPSGNQGVDSRPMNLDCTSLRCNEWNDLNYLIFGADSSFVSANPTTQGSIHELSFWNGVNVTEAEIGIGALSFVDTTVERATDYQYHVFAENSIGNGTATTSNSVLTNDFPEIVTGLTAVRLIPTQIDLQWDELPDDSGVGFPSTGVNLTKYKIFRSENGGAFTLVGENLRQSPPAIFFNDTSANAIFFYSYNIEACNELGCGNATSNFFVASPPDQPQNFNATAKLPDVFLEWSASGNATDYRIERTGALANLSIENLVVNFNFDDPVSLYNNDVGGAGERWGNDNRTKLGKNGGRCTLDGSAGIGCNYSPPLGMTSTGLMSMNTNFGSVLNQGDSIRMASGSAFQTINRTSSTDWDFVASGDWSWNAWIHPSTNTASGTRSLTAWSTIDESDLTLGGQILNGTKVLVGFAGNITEGNNDFFVVQTIDEANFGNFVLNETSPTGMWENDSTFHMFTIVHKNGEYIKWYRDGVLLETDFGTPFISGVSDLPPLMGACWNSSVCKDSNNVTQAAGRGNLNGGTVQTWLDEWSWWDMAIESSDVTTLYGNGDGFNFTGHNVIGDDGSASFEIIVPSLVDDVLAGATFFDDFSSDQGWLIKNETAMTLNTDIGRLEFNDLHSGSASNTDKIVGTRASLPLVDILGEGIGDTWSIRGKIVITEVDDDPAVNTTAHASHHQVHLGLFALTKSNATHFPADECDGFTGGEECATIQVRNILNSGFNHFWQFDVQNDTTSIGIEANLGLRTFLNVDEYYFEVIKQTDVTQSAVYTDDQFSIPFTDFQTGVPLFRITSPNTAIDFGQINHLLFGNLVNQGSNCGVHTTYTGCTFGAKGYWDYIAFWNNINTTETIPTSYLDQNVTLGTQYSYRVTALNGSIPSEPSEVASVLTNDIPAKVQNAQAIFNIPTQVDIQWNDLAFDSGIGDPSTGLNLTKYKVFRENVTASTPFELIAEILPSSPPENFYNDTAAEFPDVFNYQISGCNDVGCGPNSTASQTLVTDPPFQLENMLATAVDKTVSLDWDDTTFALNYTITRGLLNASHVIIAQGVLTSDYIDTTVAINTNYTYSAWGVNNNGNGTTGFSNSVLTNNIPTEPLNLTGAMGIVIPDLEDVFLEWDIELDNGTGNPSTGVPIIDYTIERKQGLGSFAFLVNVSGGIFAYEDESIVSGANYTWHVKGTNAVGMSPFSNTFSIITTPLMPPDTPTDLSATTLSGSEIQLDWLAAVTGDPATEYVLQERHVGFGGFSTIATIPAPTLTFTSPGLVAGDTYDYQLRADNGAGSSGYSNIATNTTFTVPTAPQNLIADTDSDTQISLDWEEPVVSNGGIVKYNIEQESPIGGGFSEIAEIINANSQEELFLDDLFNNNGTIWQYRQAKSGVGFQFSFCTVTGLPDRVRCSWSDGGGSTGTVYIFKTFPRSFLNNTQIQISLSETDSTTFSPHTSKLTKVSIEKNNYLDRNREAEWPVLTVRNFAVDILDGSSPVGIIDAQTHAVLADTDAGQTFDMIIPAVSSQWNSPSSNYSSIIIEFNDGNSLASSARNNIFWINITDIDTGDQRAFYNFSGSSRTNEAQDASCTPKCARGTITAGTSTFINSTGFESQILNATNTQFTVTGLITKTEYNFRVNAENLIGPSPFSNEAANTTFGVPDAPINLSGVSNGVSEITVTWDEGLNDFGSAVTGYRIDQAQGIGGTFVTAIANTGDNIEPLSETFIGLLQQTQYIYRIAAINGFGLSPFSANLTTGTFIGSSAPENFFVIFNATKPYSTFMSWETPLTDGGQPIAGYLIERKDTGGIFQLIANLTSPLLLNYTDTNLLQLIEHEYRVAAYSNPTGSFTPGQPVATVVAPNFQNFVINEFQVVGDVLSQQYSITIDDCFPACTLTQADIIRNGITEANYAVGEPITLDTELNFTSHFILTVAGTQFINTSAIVTNLGATGDNETGVVTTSLEFIVDTIFFNHSRNDAFTKLNFELVRHPVPWNAECEIRGGRAAITDTIIEVLPFGGTITLPGTVLLSPTEITATLSLQGVGTYDSNPDEIQNPKSFNVLPSRNAYMSCDDPVGLQILAFVSFGTGNGTLALTGFTNQLGTFLGVPVPFIFIIILAAIWTGRSASTGIIFLAVAIGAMGVLGYFDPLSGDPTQGDTPLAYFWLFIVFLTLVGVFLGKRFF